jgi:lysophospholipase L1-like esterase
MRRRLLLAASSLLATLALLEAGLRLLGPSPDYFVQVPGTEWTIAAAPEAIRGIEGVSRYRVNANGIRGRPFGRDAAEYRFLAVGGSTTECAQLDETEVWTFLLERALRPRSDGRRVWVGNVGRSGMTTREHVLHLERLLPQYPRIDVVLSMVGANDMLSALKQGSKYRPIEPRPSRAFVLVPGRSVLWQTVRRAKLSWSARRSFGPEDARGLLNARQARREARTWLDDLPDLNAPLDEYRRNLLAMAGIATARDAALVLITQPSRWKANASDEDGRDFWFGWVGEDWPTAEAYFTTGALERAMAAYNQTLLRVCRERGLDCVDAAALLPADEALFYDDLHFTEAGSRRLAEVLAAHLER